MRIRIRAFASLREILASLEGTLNVPEEARVGDAWAILAQRYPDLAAHRASVRVARNGRLTDFDERLSDGDEIALLPPVGGG